VKSMSHMSNATDELPGPHSRDSPVTNSVTNVSELFNFRFVRFTSDALHDQSWTLTLDWSIARLSIVTLSPRMSRDRWPME
jgi:hypothetical protein